MTLYLGYSLGSAPIVSFHYGAGNHAELKIFAGKVWSLSRPAV